MEAPDPLAQHDSTVTLSQAVSTGQAPWWVHIVVISWISSKVTGAAYPPPRRLTSGPDR